MDAAAEEIARAVVRRLEDAWNAGDGEAFGEPFADDADFVDFRGTHHRGRQAIAAGHRGIFESVYRGSRIAYEVQQARPLREGVILVHSTAALSAPAGPLAGEHRATQSLVLVSDGAAWQIASFHNTLVAPLPRPGTPPATQP
jgi:uncharacterized protein (TIGR02246 family)